MRFRVFVLLVFCLAVCAGLRAQVVAGFNIIVPTSNCNPAVYSFVNTSTGTGLTYRWNFGVYAGVNSVFTNPSATYVDCGSYNVKLVATDQNGVSDSITQTVSIKCSPKAQFITDGASGCVPLTAGFTSTSTPGSGSIVNYSWDFGDGNGDTTQNPNHTYYGGGCKNVTLIVTNNFNCSNDTTVHNVVCAFPAPASSFTSGPTTSCQAPFNVNYQATSTGGMGPYTYQWIFQGGTPATSTAANPTVTYSAAGNFNTTLITTDAHGCVDTTVQPGYIFIPSDVANFTMDTNPRCAPAKIVLTADSNMYTSGWNWSVTAPGNMGQNGQYTDVMTFIESGNYTICLTIDYTNGCTAQRCTTVYVSSPPLAQFGVSGDLNTCLMPDAITFLDSSQGDNLTYNWSFPGGTPAVYDSATPPLISYNQCGSFSAGLTVTNPAGCVSSAYLSNFLNIPCNVASFTASPANGCLPLTTSFNSDASTGNPVSWLWDFGDPGSGTDTSTLQNPTHVFNSPGCHDIKLTTTTAQGCVYVDTLVGGVCAGFKPHANFSGNPPVNCANKPIFFTDSSTNEFSYTNYYWNFHTPTPFVTESTDSSPTYIYNQAGVWSVTLIVSNYSCADTITKDSYVTTILPVAQPAVTPNCGNPLSVILDGSGSQGAQTYEWIVIGGTPDSSSNETVVATFPGPGTYSASLYVTNDTTGCTDLVSTSVNISGPEAEFSASPLVGCSPMQSCFSNSSTTVTSFQWHINNDDNSIDTTFTTSSPCFEFVKPGMYNVRLVTGDSSGCTDTIYKPHYIVVSHPSAGFTGAPVSGCAPLSVNFTDASTYKVKGIANWKWNFGDNFASTDSSLQQVASHIYNNAGTYTVGLTITDSSGCVSSDQRLNYIVVDKPEITFTGTSSSGCAGVNACFTSSTINTGLHYNWIFGDSTTSASASPCHLYTHSGNYNVAVVATDGAGCTDTFTQAEPVQVVIPHPSFVADTTTATCPPISVSFTNLTTGADPQVTWYWRFGDGQVSTLQNPFHIYASPGNFTVTLISSVPNGCVDSVVYVDYIRISGPTATLAAPPTGGCVPHSDCLHAFSTNTVSYTWDFGDGTVLPGADSICYTYTRTGSYYPQLVLDNGLGCVYAMPLGNVNINGAVAYFKANNPGLCGSGIVQFTDSSFGTSPVQSHAWNFGDPGSGVQNTSSLANPSHFYAASGSYRVIENIVSVDGCTEADTQTVVINKLPLPVVIIVNPGPCGADSVFFKAQTTGSSAITSLLWNFGDPASGNLNSAATQSTQHFYTTPGTYTISLAASDTNGCSADTTATLTVHQKPGAAFTANNFCLNAQPMNFVNTSQFAGTYNWKFGDGAQSTLLSPAHTYSDTGTYIVQLIVQNGFCADTVKKPVQIFSLPVAAFSLSASSFCGAPAVVAVTNNSSNATGYSWNFGNGTFSSLPNPSAVYGVAGQFNILLTAVSNHGCSDTVSQNIVVHISPSSAFLVTDVCLNDQPMNFTNLSQNAGSYNWSFGDGSSSSAFSPQHSYGDTGIYVVSLISQNEFCNDTLTKRVAVFSLPVASFEIPDSAKCGPNAQFAIINQSTNATGYSWSLGNSTTSTDTNPTAVYSAAGTYTVQLIANSNHGCLDTLNKTVTVYPKPAAPQISIQPDAGCAPLTVTLTANTTNADSFTWNFGTGAASVTAGNASASYTYADTGNYTLSLYMTSAQQCTDTIKMVDTIHVMSMPHAAFDTVINSSGYPYDGLVSFTNLSTNATNYAWSFGDGTTSNEFEPSHVYQYIDTYSAMLIAGNNYGCFDTAAQAFYVIKKALYVPNALQPGYEGSTELVKVWKPLGTGLLKYHAQIFDKWGKLLWESDKLSDWQPVDAWDGTFDGEPCQQDVYVWKIDAVFMDGTMWPGMSYDKDEGGGIKTIGSITLIR